MPKQPPMTQRAHPRTIAYLMSRFPKISETFILYEMIEVERLGLQVEVFPLVREQQKAMHPEAERYVKRAHFHKLFSGEVLAAQLFWLAHNPKAYLRAWWEALLGNAQSPKFLSRALAVVPHAALFARQMLALGVQHLHAHWATHPALAAYVVHLLTGLPYSFTAHADDIYVEQAMLDAKMRAASFVVTISDYNREFLRNLYGDRAVDKVIVIHCGVDLTVFQPIIRETASEQITILTVARLEPKKGHPFLIEACALLRERGISFRCLLVGDGEDRDTVAEQIARLNLSDHVQLLGVETRSRVTELMSEADVVVLPSITTSQGRQEGIPVALMEALASARPVVATRISGIPELIEDGVSGLLVPERDAQALAEAIQLLRDDPTLGKRLGQAGLAKVANEFNLQQNAATLATLLSYDWKKTTATSVLLEYLAFSGMKEE